MRNLLIKIARALGGNPIFTVYTRDEWSNGEKKLVPIIDTFQVWGFEWVIDRHDD